MRRARWPWVSCTSARNSWDCCHSNATHLLATMASVMPMSTSTKSAWRTLPIDEMRPCFIARAHRDRHVQRPMLGSRRDCASTTSRAHTEGAKLHLLMVLPAPCSVQHVVERYGLHINQELTLAHNQFISQELRPKIAAIYLHTESSPLAVAHRCIGTRTQTRIELDPGSCVLRSKDAQRQWTLAIPPLLGMMQRRSFIATRRITVLSSDPDANVHLRPKTWTGHTSAPIRDREFHD